MKYLLFFVLSFFIFVSCNRQNEINIKTIQLPKSGNEIVEANNVFGLNTFIEVINNSDEEENIIFSPLSLNIALLMTLNGANGTTSDEMKEVLQLSDLSIDEINECYEILVKELVSTDRKVNFSIANSIWFDNSILIYSDFSSSLKNSYNAQIEVVDFSNPNTVNDVNSWVKRNTNKKIDKIIDAFEPDEIMALLNAIYFEGKWHFDFKASETSFKDFYLPDSSIIQVETMMQTKDLKMGYSEIYTAVELPYGQGNFVMDVFMPNPGFEIFDVLDTLSNLENIINDFYETEVELFLPKFEYKYKVKLNDILTTLGMSTAFSNNADFSKISEVALAISRVLQKCYIKTDEKGTEAVAVTFVGMDKLSMPQTYETNFNKPFIYIIREVSTNTVIFMGRVANPSVN